MAIDHLSDALNTLKTHENVGQRECSVKATKVTGELLRVFKEHNYIKDFVFSDDGRGGFYTVVLDGRINNCGIIKPRFAVKRNEWAEREQEFIPGVGVGLLIVSTSKGITTNREAEKERIGGRLIAYVY